MFCIIFTCSSFYEAPSVLFVPEARSCDLWLWEMFPRSVFVGWGGGFRVPLWVAVSRSSLCASSRPALHLFVSQRVVWSGTAGPQVQTSFLPLPGWRVLRGSGCTPYPACTPTPQWGVLLLEASDLRVIGVLLFFKLFPSMSCELIECSWFKEPGWWNGATAPPLHGQEKFMMGGGGGAWGWTEYVHPARWFLWSHCSLAVKKSRTGRRTADVTELLAKATNPLFSPPPQIKAWNHTPPFYYQHITHFPLGK